MLKEIPQSEWHDSMRGHFGGLLYNEMINNPKIVVIAMGLGYGLFDRIRDDFPDRFYEVGASEQAGLGIGVGMALQGFIPICYSITPFLLWRAAETIRLYLGHENIPVKLVGSGRDGDYEHDGFSHDAHDAKQFLDQFPNIEQYWPSQISYAIPEGTGYDVGSIMREFLTNDKPSFISLKRKW